MFLSIWNWFCTRYTTYWYVLSERKIGHNFSLTTFFHWTTLMVSVDDRSRVLTSVFPPPPPWPKQTASGRILVLTWVYVGHNIKPHGKHAQWTDWSQERRSSVTMVTHFLNLWEDTTWETKYRWKGNFKMDLNETDCADLDWFCLTWSSSGLLWSR